MSSGGDSIRICGLAAFFKCGMAYFDTMKVPRVLMPIIRSNRFMSVACELVRLMALALLTQMSLAPNMNSVLPLSDVIVLPPGVSRRALSGATAPRLPRHGYADRARRAIHLAPPKSS